MTEIFLDIETARLPSLKAPPDSFINDNMGNRSDPEKIAEKQKANIDRWYEDAPLDWKTGQIIAVGFCRQDDTEPEILTTEEWSEASLLERFWLSANWRHSKIIGFNVREFDLPFLIGRCAPTGNRPHRIKLTPYHNDLGVVDLQDELVFYNNKKKKGWSLAYYCDYFELPTEPYGTGADVAEWYRQGQWGEIRKHLESDVLMTRDLYNFCATAFGI